MSMSAKTVLYAEDEESDAVLLNLAFKRAGLEGMLTVVEDGKKAIDYLVGAGTFADRAVHPFPALVLLDVKLPLKTGFEVLEWMRKQASMHSMPVAMLSSSFREADRDKSVRLGANDYLVKPSLPHDTLKMVQSLKERWLG